MISERPCEKCDVSNHYGYLGVIKLLLLYTSIYKFIFQCLLVGDSEGQVSVYQMRSMPPHADVSCFKHGVHSFLNDDILYC